MFLALREAVPHDSLADPVVKRRGQVGLFKCAGQLLQKAVDHPGHVETDHHDPQSLFFCGRRQGILVSGGEALSDPADGDILHHVIGDIVGGPSTQFALFIGRKAARKRSGVTPSSTRARTLRDLLGSVA